MKYQLKILTDKSGHEWIGIAEVDGHALRFDTAYGNEHGDAATNCKKEFLTSPKYEIGSVLLGPEGKTLCTK